MDMYPPPFLNGSKGRTQTGGWVRPYDETNIYGIAKNVNNKTAFFSGILRRSALIQNAAAAKPSEGRFTLRMEGAESYFFALK
ncbi:MAG: hypothetical protein MSB10_00820 [Clostridiales bacterium]|uniref:hypothetical protein n=1 Tax=Flavonifractor porci TaxID=3133422 RepID=UPI0030B4BED4|nr:hypothetical protein [Clostridiales bacterium]